MSISILFVLGVVAALALLTVGLRMAERRGNPPGAKIIIFLLFFALIVAFSVIYIKLL